jgi:hypothetical protein
MLVPMMNIRVVRVMVQHLEMVVRMTMSLMVANKIAMVMPVMLIMRMAVLVLEGIVPVLVLVALGKMQPHSDTHEDGAGKEIGGDSLAENQNRHEGPDEGGE